MLLQGVLKKPHTNIHKNLRLEIYLFMQCSTPKNTKAEGPVHEELKNSML